MLAFVAWLSGLVFASGVLRDESTALRSIYGVLAALCLLAGFRPARRAFLALRARLEGGRFEWNQAFFSSAFLGNAFLGNIVVGHLVLVGVGVLGLAVLTVVAQIFGRPLGALLGLLLGVPCFLGFPAILERLASRRLAREPESGRPLGWGYLMLLGLAALFVIVLGGEAAGKLWWQFRATERSVVTLADVEDLEGTPVYYQWPDDLRPADKPIGYDVNRLYLGDGAWAESSYYVAPLVDANSSVGSVGCVWYGLQTSEARRSSASVRRLLEDRPPWMVEAVGFERSGFRAAVEEALQGAAEVPSCQPRVLEASAPRREAIGASIRRLGVLHGLAHGLPLLILAAWAAWRLDRPSPSPLDGPL